MDRPAGLQPAFCRQGTGVHEKLKDDRGRPAQLPASEQSPEEVVEELFLATLSRFPSKEQRGLLEQRLAAAEDDRRAVIEDILWSLLNHMEFLFQH